MPKKPVYVIKEAVKNKEKLLSITFTDKRGDMFDVVIPYINPKTIFESGFVKVLPYEGLIRRLTLKDAHIQTTRKERVFIINTSMVATEVYHAISNLDSITVVSQDNIDLYESLEKSVDEIVGKIETSKKEETK